MDKRTERKTCALILASNDWNQDPMVPMLMLEGTSVIKYEIYTLRKAGISNIIVLGGYQAPLLKRHLSHNNITFLEDVEYEKHTTQESVNLAWEELHEKFERILVCSAACPVFSCESVETLLEQNDSVILTCNEKEGSLWLISESENCVPVDRYRKIAVEDEGILLSITGNGIDDLQRYLNSRRKTKRLHIKTKLIISRKEDFFGPGIYKLLLSIQETGSIQAAAERLEMSYTKAWKMINKIEKEMGFSFVIRINGGKKGGSSALTEEGIKFLRRYESMVEDLKRIGDNLFEVYFEDYIDRKRK